MIQFYETGYGRRFFEQQLPDLIQNLGRIADVMENTSNKESARAELDISSRKKCKKKSTNADRIRSMNNEELNQFLWWFKISTMASFVENGGSSVMDAKEQHEWLNSENDEYLKTLMHHER